MRGLKRLAVLIVDLFRVAPYTGAWIETRLTPYTAQMTEVAPYTGAWIETPISIDTSVGDLSHLIRVRGLKHL